MFSSGRALDPDKADLLDAIMANGSITAAARAFGISYTRAWLLVADLNDSFKAPLVHVTNGGGRGCHATLTATGRSVLAAYRVIEANAQNSASAALRKLHELAAKSEAK